jgi:hypothetical protein
VITPCSDLARPGNLEGTRGVGGHVIARAGTLCIRRPGDFDFVADGTLQLRFATHQVVDRSTVIRQRKVSRGAAQAAP